MEDIVIIGAGGHAKVCYEIAESMNQWSEITILDDKCEENVKYERYKISQRHKAKKNRSQSFCGSL